MGKYKRLLSNTAILGAGTFASKVLVLLLMPFYTSILSTAEFGTADLISQTANLLIPLAAVGICDGIFRFTLDSAEDKRTILSTGIDIGKWLHISRYHDFFLRQPCFPTSR